MANTLTVSAVSYNQTSFMFGCPARLMKGVCHFQRGLPFPSVLVALFARRKLYSIKSHLSVIERASCGDIEHARPASVRPQTPHFGLLTRPSFLDRSSAKLNAPARGWSWSSAATLFMTSINEALDNSPASNAS